jgi:hypothetical protein
VLDRLVRAPPGGQLNLRHKSPQRKRERGVSRAILRWRFERVNEHGSCLSVPPSIRRSLTDKPVASAFSDAAAYNILTGDVRLELAYVKIVACVRLQEIQGFINEALATRTRAKPVSNSCPAWISLHIVQTNFAQEPTVCFLPDPKKKAPGAHPSQCELREARTDL